MIEKLFVEKKLFLVENSSIKECEKFLIEQGLVMEHSRKVLDDLRNNGAFRKDKLTLVGIYNDDLGDVIYCCPKYLAYESIEQMISSKDIRLKEEIIKHIVLISRVLDKLAANSKSIEYLGYSFSSDSNNGERRHINRYDVARAIIIDYLENGLFSQDDRKINNGGTGKTLWSQTIKKIQPVISNGGVVYPYLKKINRFQNYDTLLTHIHVYILNQCIDYMNSMGEYTELKKLNQDYDFDDCKMLEYAKYIRTRLNRVYSNRDLHLLKALASWCDESEFYKKIGCTVNFQDVWEWVVDDVFGESLNKRSTEPKYHIGGDCFSGDHKSTAIMDSVRVFNSEEENVKCIAIYDAKYYVIKEISGNKVVGLPGNADVVKQIAYLKEIYKSCGNDKIKYSNMFIMPSSNRKVYQQLNCNVDNGLYRYIGYVEPGSFDEWKKNYELSGEGSAKEKFFAEYVGIMMVSPEELYQMFLKNSKVNNLETERYIVQKFNEKDVCK